MVNMDIFYSDLMWVIMILCIIGAVVLAGCIAIDILRSEEENKRMEVMKQIKEKH